MHRKETFLPANDPRFKTFASLTQEEEKVGLLKDGARILSVVIYVLMGWAALAALGPLQDSLGTIGFGWLVAGGLLYTVGIIFYVLDTRLKHAHGIWHLFVIAGSAAHYVAILCYVL